MGLKYTYLSDFPLKWVISYQIFMEELSFGGRWTPKLTKGPYNSSNWVEGYEIVIDKYTL